MSPILQYGRLLATIPQRLRPVEAPKIQGLAVYGAELKGTGTRFFGAWTAEGGNFVGWMRTRPNLAGEAPDAVHATGEVLGRSVLTQEESNTGALPDAQESFRRALQEAAEDMGLD